MSSIRPVVSAMVLIAASHFFDPISIRGSDVDELRDRAASMHREVAELIERGHEQEAARLRKQADAMLRQADRLQDERRDSLRSTMIKLLEERLQDLRNGELDLQEPDDREERLDDIRTEAARVRRELSEISEHRRDPGHREPPEAARRLEHMRMAIEHLKQAGLHDEARHVARRAEETEHRMHRDHRHDGRGYGEIARSLREIQSEVLRLREQVDELMDQRPGIGRASNRRPKPRNVEHDPPRRRTSHPRDPDPDQGDKGGLGRNRHEKED